MSWAFQPTAGAPLLLTAAGSHDASGALAADAATVSGTATRFALHAAVGALVAASAAMAGTAERIGASGTHDASGALAASAAVLGGSAQHLGTHTASGALVADPAVISGLATGPAVEQPSGGGIVFKPPYKTRKQRREDAEKEAADRLPDDAPLEKPMRATKRPEPAAQEVRQALAKVAWIPEVGYWPIDDASAPLFVDAPALEIPPVELSGPVGEAFSAPPADAAVFDADALMQEEREVIFLAQEIVKLLRSRAQRVSV